MPDIVTPSPKVKANLNGELTSPEAESAKALYGIYESFLAAGFPEQRAFDLTREMLSQITGKMVSK